jgi:hypothetical protein
MIVPGARAFANVGITVATTYTSEILTRLEGMKRLSIQAILTYGSGGTVVKVYMQTTLDQGVTWFDVACLTFATATAKRGANVISNTSVATFTPAEVTLTDNTVLSGPLGDQIRYKAVSTGTYAGNTSLAVKVVVE